MIVSLALAFALWTQTAPAAAAATQDGPIVTAGPAAGESADAERFREAVA